MSKIIVASFLLDMVYFISKHLSCGLGALIVTFL